MAYTEETRRADEARRVENEKNRHLNYPDTKALPDPVFEPFDIVLTGEEPHMEFAEIETTFGHEGIGIGAHWTDDDGFHRITIRPGGDDGEELWKLADKRIPFSLHFEPQTDPYETPWTLEIGSAAYGGMTPSETARFTRGQLAESCQCEPCQTTGPHKSDCAVHGVDTAEGIVYHDSNGCTCREPDMICEAHPLKPWPHDDCKGPGMPYSNLERLVQTGMDHLGTPKRFSIVITERPGEAWLFNLNRFNSADDIAIPEEVGRAILAQMTRDEEE